jgi:glycosyltransferase involved in cell wall biosynthesis
MLGLENYCAAGQMNALVPNDADLLARSSRVAATTVKSTRSKDRAPSVTYMADFSLALINRTGAYYICRDILDELPQYFDSVRYWRLREQPKSELLRKLAGRSMTFELSALRGAGSFPWPQLGSPDQPVLYMDPLYVLHADLKAEDIVICHDIGPATNPELYSPSTVRIYLEAYEKIARVNPGIVTVSDFTRREYERVYGRNSRFITTCQLYVRLGVGEASARPVEGVERPFLLTIGALEIRKNYQRIFEAYQRSGLHERGVSYLFGGSRGREADEILEAASKVPGVRALGYVNDFQLRWLFRNASGMVLPSLLEGFGLPPLEAAQEGLVSVVSAGGAQEEAVAGAAILVDPYDVTSIADGMVRLVDMPDEQRASILSNAQAHARSLSFARYISTFEKILARNGPPED